MPRVGLNREKLIATATAMADESGLASVSLHSLARSYGVAAPSMYKHVKNLEDLQRAIAHEALVRNRPSWTVRGDSAAAPVCQ
jgi:AcrR family transcriptional regulator